MRKIVTLLIFFTIVSCKPKKQSELEYLKNLMYAYNFDNKFILDNSSVYFSEADVQLVRINDTSGKCYFVEFTYDTLSSSRNYEGRYVNSFCLDEGSNIEFYEFGGARFEFDIVEKDKKLEQLDSFCLVNPDRVGLMLKSLRVESN